MIRLSSIVTVFCVSMSLISAAQAADFGLEAGIRSQSGDYTGSGNTTADSKSNFQFGGVGQFDISGPWRIRSGLLYTGRNLDINLKGAGNNGTMTLTYFDIPIQAMYKFEDYGGVFVGPVASMLLEKKCDFGTSCTVTGAKSMVIPFQIGATFKFMPQVGATIYYETLSGDVADGMGNYRAVGANLLFTFD
jgi:hypothetical protein